MRVIRPEAINDAVLIASNVPENDHPVWSAGTTYALGDRVIVPSTHRIYESLIASNLGNDPTVPADPPRWLDVGATNRWSMFRDPAHRLTSHAADIEVTLRPQIIDALALFNLTARRVSVTLTDALEGVVYQREVDLLDHSGVTNWYAYFFEPIVRRRDVALFDIPPYASADLAIRIVAEGGVARCGRLVVGMQTAIGLTRYNAAFSMLRFSRNEFDEFGNVKIVPRPYVKRATCEMWVRNDRFGYVYHMLAEYRDVPLVWSTANGHYDDVSLIYGHFRELNMPIQYPHESPCLLEIIGHT
jgi:hypothetical protein